MAKPVRTLVLAALAALGLGLPGAAQQSPGDAGRRLIVERGVDFPGGDLRAIYSTSLPICVDACLAEPACRALTFNTAASACFLKGAAGSRAPYPAALSARVVPAPVAAPDRIAALGFLPEATREAAARLGRAAGFPLVEPQLDAATAARLDRLLAAAGASDAAPDWLAVSAAALPLNPDDWDTRSRLRALAVSAAVNGFLRAGSPAEAGAAARALALALEAAGEGRQGLDAMRLSARLAPSPAAEAEAARFAGLYGFRLLDRQVDAEAASPRACFVMSEPLAAAGVDYADYVVVPGADLPVEARDAQLCVEGLAHGETYRMTLRAGLPAASGERLATAVEQTFYIRDRSPAARFLGRAFVLPRSAEAAIPISAVNLSEVALRIHRVGPRSLSAVLRNGDFGGVLTGAEEEALGADLGETVWEGRGELAPGALNADVVTSLPVGAALAGLAPGLYAMTARVPDVTPDPWAAAATQWFVATDLGLATLQGSDGLHVFVRSLATAEPRAGVKVTLLARNNALLGAAETDAAGRARFDPGLLRGRGGQEPAIAAAEAGDDFAFLSLAEAGLDLSDRGVAGRPAPPPVDVFLTTERGAYRPGETVYATVLARDAQVQAVEGLPLTAVLTRPDGVEAGRYPLPDQGAGGRALTLPIDPAAQRGGWRLAIHADPEAPPLAATTFLVEDFTPERLDLTLTAPEGPVDPAAGLAVAVAADFLFGAPGAGLSLEGEARLALARDLPGRPGYVFGLEDEPYQTGYAALPPTTLDAKGAARVEVPAPPLGPVSRPLTLTATFRVSDGSARPVERSLTRPVLPAAPLIGVKPLFDGAVDQGGVARFEVQAVGPDLAPLALGPADWTLERVDTTFQWYELDGQWRYEPVTRRERVANGRLDLGAAPAALEAAVDWGRYELTLTGTDGRYVATSLGFDAGWNPTASGAETPDFLEVSLDKPAYAVGDVARLRVVTRDPGRLVVTALGDRLIAAQEVEAGEGAQVVELPVTADWGPGAYVTATLIRPMDLAGRRNPARAIGLAWATVDPGPRRLAVRLEAPAETRPRGVLEASARIEGLAPGETAYATLAAVDVGILNLTGFAAPDPDGHYFGQRRLGVEIRDVYGRLIDGMQGAPGRTRQGGDGGMGFRAPPPTERLVASFSGVLTADAEGVVHAPVPLPAFNGTVRLMAVAWTARGVGEATADVLVRDPVVVQANLPRFLAPGDETRLGLDLARVAGPEGPVAVQVSASAPGLVAPGLRLTGDLVDRLSFEAALTGTAPGDPVITVETTLPSGERLSTPLALPIRANDPPLARRSRIPLDPGQTLTLDAALFDGLAPDAAATVAIGPLAAFDVPGLLTELAAYPWGCSEQLVSRAMPLLYFAETQRALGAAPAEIDARVAEAIRRVLGNQSSTGGFGLWGPDSGDPWLDAYVTDFLSRAHALGRPVPDRAFEAALLNLGNRVAGYGDFERGGEDLAYALMVLAREGRASLGDLRYYADVKAEAFATPLAQAQLGYALALSGDQPRADAMFRLASAGAAAGEPERLFRADFGSDLRDAAGVLALGVEARSQAIDAPALEAIVTAPRDHRSPQESLWSLLAAQALTAEARAGAVLVNGAAPAAPVVRLTAAEAAAAPVTVANAGAGPTLVVVTAIGVPTQPEPAQGDGYRISRALYTLDGAPADPSALAVGDRLVAVVTVTPERELEARLMVVDPLPAGLEIENPNLLRSGETGQLAWLRADDAARHVEFQAERFAAAVDWQGAEPFRLAYMVRAVSPGVFRQPAASVEDMYRPAYRARTDAGRVTIAERRP